MIFEEKLALLAPEKRHRNSDKGYFALADREGDTRDVPPPPRGPISFIFIQFLGNFSQIIGYSHYSNSNVPLKMCNYYFS